VCLAEMIDRTVRTFLRGSGVTQGDGADRPVDTIHGVTPE